MTLAARGKTVSQPVEVIPDSRMTIAAGALAARHDAAERLAALERSFNDGVVLQRRMAAERARIDSALAQAPARRAVLAVRRW